MRKETKKILIAILIVFQLVGSFIFIEKKVQADPALNQTAGSWSDTFLDDSPTNSVQDGVGSSTEIEFASGDASLSAWRDQQSNSIAIDSAKNTYIAGYQNNVAGNKDILVRKYDSNGVELWTNLYDGGVAGIDVATGIAVDSAGNVVVSGRSDNGTDFDFIVLKYNSNGEPLWSGKSGFGGIAVLYDSGDLDRAEAIAIDSADNIIVSGYIIAGTNENYYTIKYDSNGTEIWSKVYDNTAIVDGSDVSTSVAIDTLDNVIVSGFSENSISTHKKDFYTIKYNSSGAVLWEKRYNDIGFRNEAFGLAIDSLNNVVVVGRTDVSGNSDFRTIKYNSVDGTIAWNKTYNSGSSANDVARSVAIDSNGNIFVAGQIGGNTDWNFGILKYNSSGVKVWNTYSDSGYTPDVAKSVAIDSSNDIWITGFFQNSLYSVSDIFTMKYKENLNPEFQLNRQKTGTVVSSEIAPTGIILWNQFSWNDTISAPLLASINYTIEVYDNVASLWKTPLLLDASGNGNGSFADSPVDLSVLSSPAYLNYTKIRIRSDLASTNPTVNPVLSQWQVTWAPDTIAPDAISDLAVSVPTTSSLVLTWTAPGNSGTIGTATSYDIRYSTSSIDDSNWDSATLVSGEPVPQIFGTNQTMTVSSLSSGTTYYFAMKTSDEALNISSLSNVASGSTSASGSSGGGGSVFIPSCNAENMSIVINEGTSTTSEPAVNLALHAEKAIQMVISNNSDFSGRIWEKFSSSKAWTLTAGEGAKTVYAKFKGNSGADCSTISDSITFLTSKVYTFTYPDGTTIKAPESPKVFITKAQEKKWIPVPEIFEAMGYKWGSITMITQVTMDKIPYYEDTLIRTIDDYKIYLVVNGIRRHILNPGIFINYGFEWVDVKNVEPEITEQYRLAHLIRVSYERDVYFLAPNGVKKLILTPEIFSSYKSNKWEDIQIISQKEMDSYSESNIIRYEGILYLVEGEYIRMIPSKEVFEKYKLDAGLIIDVSKMDFDWRKRGEDLK